MPDEITNVAGIEIPSTDPIFLAVVGTHVLLGLACTVTGAIAMLSQKRPGRHPRYGTVYFWFLVGVFLTATGLAAVRWVEDYHLFILGALSFAAAYLGRQARRQHRRNWARLHIIGMGASYVLLLIAFYVDNGKQLPIWKELPHFTYWLLPLAVGIPLIFALCCGIRWHAKRARISHTVRCTNQEFYSLPAHGRHPKITANSGVRRNSANGIGSASNYSSPNAVLIGLVVRRATYADGPLQFSLSPNRKAAWPSDVGCSHCGH
jgi:hypothetical protein